MTFYISLPLPLTTWAHEKVCKQNSLHTILARYVPNEKYFFLFPNSWQFKLYPRVQPFEFLYFCRNNFNYYFHTRFFREWWPWQTVGTKCGCIALLPAKAVNKGGPKLLTRLWTTDVECRQWWHSQWRPPEQSNTIGTLGLDSVVVGTDSFASVGHRCLDSIVIGYCLNVVCGNGVGSDLKRFSGIDFLGLNTSWPMSLFIPNFYTYLYLIYINAQM